MKRERDVCVCVHIYISFLLCETWQQSYNILQGDDDMFGCDYSVIEFKLVHLQLNPLYFQTLLYMYGFTYGLDLFLRIPECNSLPLESIESRYFVCRPATLSEENYSLV